jgi:hypothetical protein
VTTQTLTPTAAIIGWFDDDHHDHIAVSASGFGGRLAAGMDVTPIFETSGDSQFSGFGAESTSIPRTRRSTLAPAMTINPHDVLIV